MFYIYKCLTNLLYPIIILIIFFRKILNKEEKNRYKEKLFISSFNIKRKFKKLIWIHAASIGEVKSVIPVINKLDSKNNIEFLITSITISSAKLIEKEFKSRKNIHHRFMPFDKVNLVKNFLSGWSPNLVLFVDSEIWPNFIFEIKKNKIPLVLLNARITNKTFKRWSKISSFAKEIFSKFDLCLCSSKETMKYLKIFNVKKLKYLGNIKFAGNVKKRKIFDKTDKFLSNKKFWCAASTHNGEEDLCIEAHKNLKIEFPDLLTVIIPRHIHRSQQIKSLCNKKNLQSQILNNSDTINVDSEVLIINSFGVLGKYFSLSKSIFMGKSFVKKFENNGGQNPIEAAVLGCKIYHGPFIYNFKEIYELLKNYKISEQINNVDDLTFKLLKDLKTSKNKQYKKSKILEKLGKSILLKTINEIKKIQNK